MPRAAPRKSKQRSKSSSSSSSKSTVPSREQCIRFLDQDKMDSKILTNPITGRSIKRGLGKYNELKRQCMIWVNSQEPPQESQAFPQEQDSEIVEQLTRENAELKSEINKIQNENKKAMDEVMSGWKKMEKEFDRFKMESEKSVEKLMRENSSLKEELRNLRDQYSEMVSENKSMREVYEKEIKSLKSAKITPPSSVPIPPPPPPPSGVPPPPPPPSVTPKTTTKKPDFLGQIGTCLVHEDKESCDASDECAWNEGLKECKRSPKKKMGMKKAPKLILEKPAANPLIGQIGACLVHEDKESCDANSQCSWDEGMRECRRKMKKGVKTPIAGKKTIPPKPVSIQDQLKAKFKNTYNDDDDWE